MKIFQTPKIFLIQIMFNILIIENFLINENFNSKNDQNFINKSFLSDEDKNNNNINNFINNNSNDNNINIYIEIIKENPILPIIILLNTSNLILIIIILIFIIIIIILILIILILIILIIKMIIILILLKLKIKNFRKLIKKLNCDHDDEWDIAIQEELKNLYDNNTMTFVKKLPRGKRPNSTRWVFAIKKDANNGIIKRKARLVAKGFALRYGIDYELTYSPTLNVDCIKLLLAFAAQFQWTVYKLDFKSAYLNAALYKEIYTEIPYGDENYGKGYWVLNKALDGLKQSGR